MKKYLITLLSVLLMVTLLIACNNTEKEKPNNKTNDITVKNEVKQKDEKENNSNINLIKTKAYVLNETSNSNESTNYSVVVASTSNKLLGRIEISVLNELNKDNNGNNIKIENKQIYNIVIQEKNDNNIYIVNEISLSNDDEKQDWYDGRSTNNNFKTEFEELKAISPKEAYKKVYEELQFKWTYEQIEVYKVYMEQQMQTSDELKGIWNDAYTSVGKTLGY